VCLTEKYKQGALAEIKEKLWKIVYFVSL
jgi:hypothetical protein